jgi:hypothetical protein
LHTCKNCVMTTNHKTSSCVMTTNHKTYSCVLWFTAMMLKLIFLSFFFGPVRIQVKIDPPHPLGGPLDETGKTKAPCHSRCGTIKIPPCSKAPSAKHRPKFDSPSPVMLTSPCKWKILERDVKQLSINLLFVFNRTLFSRSGFFLLLFFIIIIIIFFFYMKSTFRKVLHEKLNDARCWFQKSDFSGLVEESGIRDWFMSYSRQL